MAIISEHLKDGFSEKEGASDQLAEEIERRIDAYDRGEIKAIDADGALAWMRCYLDRHRNYR